MSLRLDARQRAMLEEMGIRVFWPEAPELLQQDVDVAPVRAEPVALRAEPAPVREEPVAARTQPIEARARPMPSPATGQAERPAARERVPGIELLEWDALQQAVAECQACSLCDGRRKPVFGVGDRQADWLVVGDGPDEQDELQGEPFTGQAGKLLDNMLAAMGVSRQRGAYIANVLKCRPVGRNPEPEEIAQCEPYLRRQVQLLQPKIILAMGRFAVQALLQTGEPTGKLRGRVHRYEGVPVVVTYPPAYLLRNLPDKARAWADLCLAQAVLREAGG